VEGDRQFWWINIVCRFVEGIGDSWVQTACFSLISLKFPENREKYIGLGEAASGIGLMAGPGIAGILYTYFGYFEAFLGFAIFIIFSAIFCYFYIPESR
jgi:MFS family permease